MKPLCPALLAALAFELIPSPGHGQSVVSVERGQVAVIEPLSGTVIPAEKEVIAAPGEGRVEALPIPTQSPFRKREVLAIVSGPDLAAIIDSHATTPQEVVQERWQKIFKPMRLRAPFDGFLLETKVGLKEKVKADQSLFVVTRRLQFEAAVPLRASSALKPGMRAWLWRPANPALHFPGALREVLPGVPVADKARVRVDLLPAEDIALPLPGTVLEGSVTVSERRNVVVVPSAALQHVEGRSFVAVEVKEGISDGQRTEILAGLSAGQAILVPGRP